MENIKRDSVIKRAQVFNRCVQEMWALILSPWEQINIPCLKNERGDQLFSKYIPQTFMVLKM